MRNRYFQWDFIVANLTKMRLHSAYYEQTESLTLAHNHHDLETSFPSKLLAEECVEAMEPTHNRIWIIFIFFCKKK